MRVFLVLSAFFALTAVSLNGGEHLSLAVSPAMSFAPSNVNIRARLVPSPDNRVLEIVAESGAFYRSSQIPLEGDRSPATIMLQFRGLPGGEYSISAALIDSMGRRRAVVERPLKVIGELGE